MRVSMVRGRDNGLHATIRVSVKKTVQVGDIYSTCVLLNVLDGNRIGGVAGVYLSRI